MYKNEYEKEIVAIRDWFAGVYREKFEPKISIRTSLADFEINNGLYNIPLFMAGKFDEILKWK